MNITLIKLLADILFLLSFLLSIKLTIKIYYFINQFYFECSKENKIDKNIEYYLSLKPNKCHIGNKEYEYLFEMNEKKNINNYNQAEIELKLNLTSQEKAEEINILNEYEYNSENFEECINTIFESPFPKSNETRCRIENQLSLTYSVNNE